MGLFLKLLLFETPGMDFPHDMDTGGSGVNDRTINLDHLTDIDRFVKPDATDIDRYALALGPIPGAGISCLIDPFHHRTSLEFFYKMDIGRFADEFKYANPRSCM